MSGPRKWLRSATSIFSTRSLTNAGQFGQSGQSGQSGMMPMPQPPAKQEPRAQRSKKFDAPVPLSEFAKRSKTAAHSHNGRRDALSAGERTRILRMLRDEGGRLADEDSQVFIGSAPGGRDRDYDFDFDDSPAPAPTTVRPDVPAKPAVVVGLAQAQAARSTNKRSSEKAAVPPSASHPRPAPVPQPPPRLVPVQAPPPPGPRSAPPPSQPPPPPRSRQLNVPQPPPSRRPVPVPFGEEPTRQVDDELLTALRNAPPAKASPKAGLPRPGVVRPARHDEPTRLASLDSLGVDDGHGIDDLTRPADDYPPRFLSPAAAAEPGGFEDHRDPEEATRLASLDGIAAMERARNHGPSHDERTRAVNIRNDPSISDIDWDLD